ncbi:CatB-related O-acetyltransferase [Myroides guanonis]|uniref:Chloramphenicol O-acetyltransferase type B n=1 Tax=Myroides guanonis TaxID=1150112 RepID=A0A1I3LFD0_9FLAO|nr:CatB-related O-acetyltransferase [Myroides guanonis]SFI83230.1 chloramphenicol O-acetyltransferase type B [Myroides guanonis]
MNIEGEKHWSKVEKLHETVKNPNIHIKGTKSYYSDAWTGSFEESVVRYLYGDSYSLKNWEPIWELDQLYIGNFVCIGAEVIILMGGNNTHRMDWFSLYPFKESIVESYQQKGDTIIDDGAWLGIRSVIMPGVTIGEGAVVAAGSIVTKNVPAYSIVGGNPAKVIGSRFEDDIIKRLINLKIYDLSEENLLALQPYLSSNDLNELFRQVEVYKAEKD